MMTVSDFTDQFTKVKMSGVIIIRTEGLKNKNVW